jgi:hypothetical protein
MSESKSLIRSRLFWLGALQVGVGTLELIKTNVLDSETAAWGAVATGTITIVLRLLTTQPVHLSEPTSGTR